MLNPLNGNPKLMLADCLPSKIWGFECARLPDDAKLVRRRRVTHYSSDGIMNCVLSTILILPDL